MHKYTRQSAWFSEVETVGYEEMQPEVESKLSPIRYDCRITSKSVWRTIIFPRMN